MSHLTSAISGAVNCLCIDPRWSSFFDKLAGLGLVALVAAGVYNRVLFPPQNKIPPDPIQELKKLGYAGIIGEYQHNFATLLQRGDYAEMRKRIWTEENLDFAVFFLKHHVGHRGHPILMLEISRILQRKMEREGDPSLEKKQEIIEWYVKGSVMVELDLAGVKSENTKDKVRAELRKLYFPPDLLPTLDASRVILKNLSQNWNPPTGFELMDCLYLPRGLYPEEHNVEIYPVNEWNERRAVKLQEIKQEFAKEVL